MGTEDLAIKGLTFARVRRVTYGRGGYSDAEAILFEPADGTAWAMYHDQECCEEVKIESIAGDLADLEGVPLVEAYVSHKTGEGAWGNCTWTFYHFRTSRGDVTVRWYGESNGYYSERAELRRIDGMEWLFEGARDSAPTEAP